MGVPQGCVGRTIDAQRSLLEGPLRGYRYAVAVNQTWTKVLLTGATIV